MAATYALESAALRCWDTVSLLVSPEVAEFCRTKSEKYGVGLSGALFGVGAWIWLDAVATSPVKVPFSQVGEWLCVLVGWYRAETLVWQTSAPVPSLVNTHAIISLQYLPGIIAMLALLMITAVRRCAGEPWQTVSCKKSGLLCSQTLPHPHPWPRPARRDQVDYDPFGDEGVYCRLRSWLLAAYVVSFVAVGGAVIVMLHHFGDATQGEWGPHVGVHWMVHAQFYLPR